MKYEDFVTQMLLWYATRGPVLPRNQYHFGQLVEDLAPPLERAVWLYLDGQTQQTDFTRSLYAAAYFEYEPGGIFSYVRQWFRKLSYLCDGRADPRLKSFIP